MFSLPGEMGLSFTLYYNTALKLPQTQSNPYWSTNLQYSLTPGKCFIDKQGNENCHSVIYLRPDGSEIVFNGVPQTGPYTENGGGGLATLSYDSASSTYTLHDEDATTKVFDVNGFLLSITNPSGIRWTISQSGSSSGLTYTVTHSSGKSFSITYGTASNGVTPVTVTDPAGNVYALQMTGAVLAPDFLSITYPGTPATTVSFKYSSALPDHLTEVDYNGAPYDYTDYDTTSTDPYYGWATANYFADHSGSVSISYAKDAAGNLQATVTNALGHHHVQTYDGTNGTGGAYNGQLSQMSDDAVATCGATVASRTYDVNGNLAQTVDNNGIVHTYNYAVNGQLQSETEAYGTSLARTTDYVWDPNLQLNRLLSVTVEGLSKTTYAYNGQNRLASVAVTNLSGTGTANQTLTTTYNYALYANGMVQTMTVTHPSPNNSNIDTYTFDTLGNATSVTNGLGQTNSYSNYNALGEPGSVTGPNGDVVNYTYDARGRVSTKTTHPNGGSATWTYGYDGFGLLSSLSGPDGQMTTWNRNQVMQVASITHNDKDGISTESFQYDANGDVTQHTIARGSTNSLIENATYDALGRIYQQQGQHGQLLTYAYDGNGNVLSITNAAGHVTSHQYDALNRVTKTIESGGASPSVGSTAQATATISYLHDAGNQLTSVTDPRGLVTGYVYDGFGQLWQQTSPDTGTTSFIFDGNGRRTSMTRANGVQTTYTYDAIGRVTGISAGGQSHSFTYDSCTNGTGRLCTATDASGHVGYSYTPEGWVSNRFFTIGSVSYSVGYAYNATGDVAAVIYPDGNQAIYNYTNGVVSSVSLNIGGTGKTAASQITYQPMDSALASWVGSNGLTTSLYYDTDGRFTGANVPAVLTYGIYYDNANRVAKKQDFISPVLTENFGYDEQSRLVSETGGAENESYQYDANGNRIAQTVNGTSMNLIYEGGSNRMINAGGVTFGYDAMGNTTVSNGTSRWQFDPFNRMTTAFGNTYYIDPLGRRLMKSVSGATTYFAPDESNHLFAENDAGAWVDYLWLNGRLIARITAGQVQDIHVDQLGRPEAMTDSSQALAWRAMNFPFSRSVATNNVVPLNIGFPGQYFDAELNLWNNGARDYFPWVGRYLESDPIGLEGGINTYAYAGNNPLSAVDPLGLYCLPEWKIRAIGAAAAGAGAGAYYGRGGGPLGAVGGALAGALINGSMGAVDGLTDTTQANGFATGMFGAMVTAATKGELVAGLLGGGLGGAIANEMFNRGHSRAVSNAVGGSAGAALGSATYSWFAGASLGSVAQSGLKGGIVGAVMSLGQSGIEAALRAGNDCPCNQKQ